MAYAALAATILAKLEGEDRRSLGRSAEVVRQVLQDRSSMAALIQGLRSADPIVRMRAADALEKVTRARPDWLGPFKTTLLWLAAESSQQEVRWHFAQVLPRLRCSPRERRAVVSTLLVYLQDHSSIVRTCALQALADVAMTVPTLRAMARTTIEAAMADGTPAMRARGRKLLAHWPQDSKQMAKSAATARGDERAAER